MKKIIFTFFLFTSIDAYALPACPDISEVWNNCYGTYYFSGKNLGDKYTGEWKNDKRHGQGTYTHANGDKYVGNFKDEKYHGQGTYTYANGDKYVGNFKDGKIYGQGTYTYADGAKYVGNFKDEKYHGQGTYIWPEGKRETGFYMNNEYIPDICKNMGLSINSSGYEKCINRLIDEVLN